MLDWRMELPMIPDISLHRGELRQLCRRFRVRRLDVFGSAARDDFDQRGATSIF
jgi:predicted nucleotidyltransferase